MILRLVERGEVVPVGFDFRAVGNVETVFIMTGDQHALTSSSLIRQVVALGGDLKPLESLLPAIVIDRLARKLKRGRILHQTEPDAPAN